MPSSAPSVAAKAFTSVTRLLYRSSHFLALPFTGHLVTTINIYDLARLRRLEARIISYQSDRFTILYIVVLSIPDNDGENPYLDLTYP